MITTTDTTLAQCRKDDLTRERGYDFLIFRADDSGRIISGFPHSRFMSTGLSAYTYEFPGGGRRDYIASMLAGYSRSPFLVTSQNGCTLIVRSMVPEANLCAAAVFPYMLDYMRTLATAGELDLVVLPPDSGAPYKGGHARAAGSDNNIRYAYGLIREGFYTFNPGDVYSGTFEIIRKAATAARSLALIASCKCSFTDGSMTNTSRVSGLHKQFCSDVFTVFTLLSLTACGRCGVRRDAEVSFTAVDGEFIVEIVCEINNDSTVFPELDECRRIADRKRLFYESSVSKTKNRSTLFIRFCPARYDWSVLGLKSNIPFNFD